MKIYTLIMMLLLAFSMQAQNAFQYEVTVMNRKGRTQGDVKIWLKNKKTGKQIAKRTDGNGKVAFDIPSGNWSVNLVGWPNYRELEIPEGASGRGSIMVSYDQKEVLDEQAIIAKRRNMVFEEIDQNGLSIRGPKEGFFVANVMIMNEQGRPQLGVDVQLVGTAKQEIYKRSTDGSGKARFIVPIGDNYAIDVDGIKNFNFTGRVTREGMATIMAGYEKTKIDEYMDGDTILQNLPANAQATSSRVLTKIEVEKPGGDVYVNEPVFLYDVDNHKYYKAVTNDEGIATILLPVGARYLVSFSYSKDVDVLNFRKVRGVANSTNGFVYKPNPKLQYPERYLPTAETIFLNEFNTFLAKQYPKPKDRPIDLHLKWGNKVNAQSKEAILEVGVSGASDNNEYIQSIPPIDFAFVMDRSGSMAGYDRIESLKETLESFSSHLREQDRICLVSFESEPSLDMPLEKNAVANFKKYVSEMEAGGGTNIYKGMVMGYEQLANMEDRNPNQHLVLLTDGYGVTEHQVVVDKAKSYMDKGIRLSAVGVGEDYNYALLKLLTGEQGSLLGHAGTAAEIKKAFEEQLSSIIFPVAEDATLEIVFNNKVKFKKLFGAGKEVGRKTGSVTFDLGTIHKDYNKMFLAQFDLNKPDISIEKEPVTIKVSYFDHAKQKRVSYENKAALDWQPATGEMELLVEQETKKLHAIAIMNQSIKVMVEAVANKDHKGAKKALQRTLVQVRKAFPGAKDKDIKALVDEMENYVLAIDNYLAKYDKQ